MNISTRTAEPQDRKAIAALVQHEPYLHSHLDWRSPLEWLGEEPFLVAERGAALVAALACPPEAPGVSWIRVFASAGQMPPALTWRSLWQESVSRLQELSVEQVAVIPVHRWFRKILERSGFHHSHNVVLLAWEHERTPPPAERGAASIREMTLSDLPDVVKVDRAAFNPLWRNSLSSIELAWRQSAIATVVEDPEGLIGYQISTPSPRGGHLARLAVHPRAQRSGVGFALLQDLLRRFQARAATRITVNTQHDNASSLSLYEKAGFRRTGEKYPVYQFFLT